MQSLRHIETRPTHPGEILREDVLPAMGVTQEQLATLLGVSRRTISEIIHERRPVTADMAIRLGRLFGTTPTMWLNMQYALDVWELEHANKSKYSRIKKFPNAHIADVG